MTNAQRVIWREWLRGVGFDTNYVGFDEEYGDALFELIGDARGGLREAIYVGVFMATISLRLSLPPLFLVAFLMWCCTGWTLDWHGVAAGLCCMIIVAGCACLAGAVVGAVSSWRTSLNVIYSGLWALDGAVFGLIVLAMLPLAATFDLRDGKNEERSTLVILALGGLLVAAYVLALFEINSLALFFWCFVGASLTCSILGAIIANFCSATWAINGEDACRYSVRFYSPGFRPDGIALEEALRQFKVPLWNTLLGTIKTRVESDRDIVLDVFDESWQGAFVAQHVGMRRGVRSVRVRDFYGGKKPLSYIAAGNRALLKPRKGRRFLCSQCLLRVVRHRVSPQHQLWMYGCRGCRRGETALKYSGEVLAVLDHGMTEKFEQDNGDIRVNALAVNSPFDFDRVVVGRVDYAQLEAFLVLVRNDCDKTRRRRAGRIPCELTANSNVSENLKRALGKTFRGVTAEQAATPARRFVA